jgi:hypothetical protein
LNSAGGREGEDERQREKGEVKGSLLKLVEGVNGVDVLLEAVGCLDYTIIMSPWLYHAAPAPQDDQRDREVRIQRGQI